MGVRARAHACVFRVCFVFATEAVSGGWKVCGKVSARRLWLALWLGCLAAGEWSIVNRVILQCSERGGCPGIEFAL